MSVSDEKALEEPTSSPCSTDSPVEAVDDETSSPSLASSTQLQSEFEEVFARFGRLQEKALRKTRETVLGDDVEGNLFGDEPEDKAISSAQGVSSQNKLVTDDVAAIFEKPQRREKKERLSRRQLKALLRPDVASLKLNCARPDVVEVWDTTAPDPRLLVWLKAYRNTVRVPTHWNQKRKYLSGKRAVEKVPFKLPDYIEQTKIGEIRAALLEKESQKSLKQKQREKARPRSNRMHVDFQTLHDAFFKYATKPELSVAGDLYYEGKEREEKTRQFKPGLLSSKLREALGIVLPSQPPPWIIPMQRFGPPPSYPNLKVSGVNAPLPSGGQWGVHAGGWGKPPSDHFGNPLYPAVFAEPPFQKERKEDTSNLVFWGELLELNVDDDYSDEDEEGEGSSFRAGGDSSSMAADTLADAEPLRCGPLSSDSLLDIEDGNRAATPVEYGNPDSGTASVISGASTPMVDDVWAMLGGKQ